MVSAAIIGTALGGGVAGPDSGIYVGGLDVSLKPGSSSNRYGVPLDSIEVTENGPGGVSSMRFVVEDPSSELSVSNGDEVLFHNHVTDVPVFRGWVQHWTVTVFGVGRQYELTAIGVETVLDWMVVPTLTIAAGTDTYVAIQQLVAAATGIGVALNVASGSNNGNQAEPLGRVSPTAQTGIALTFDGTSLREAIRTVIEASSSGTFGEFPLGAMATVDFWLGLRVFATNVAPSDYTSLVLTDTPAGPIQGAALTHEQDAGEVVQAVYVKGGNAAGTGIVNGGTGIVGPVAYLEDSSILTSAARDAAGLAYLADNQESLRGSVRRETFTDTSTPAAHITPRSLVTITDAQIGLSSSAQRIMQIQKVFHGGGLETWTISYGGMPPSLPRAIRRLTRDVRS